MHNIALPKKIEFEKGAEPNEGKIIIEPLYPGYGNTLGSCLRRALLSSLPGAAVVGIKIKGADHEFTALPHLKEDALEFILNMKKIRLKVFSEETVKLELSVHGQKEIKAKDIAKSGLAEILNPDLTLGHITDMAGKLEAEIFARRGLGYETIEARNLKNNEIGYIEMDSIYSPISRVGLEVTDVRVGKMTNWDRLTIDLATDGTISPEEAFKYAVNILIEQFSDLIAEKGAEEAAAEATAVFEAEKKEPEPVLPEAAEAEKQEEPEKEEKKRKRGRPRKTE